MNKIKIGKREYLLLNISDNYEEIKQYDKEEALKNYQLEDNECFVVVSEKDQKNKKIAVIEIRAYIPHVSSSNKIKGYEKTEDG
jgi:hypothetical protein